MKVNHLTKTGDKSYFVGPEPPCDLPLSHIKMKSESGREERINAHTAKYTVVIKQ